MASVGATIRSLRVRVGLSQDELAGLVGMSQGQISRLERDRSEIIRPQILVRIASVLGVSPSALLPDSAPWRDAPIEHRNPGGVFRVGFWESVWTASVVGIAEALAATTSVSSRMTAQVQGVSLSRPLTPRELLGALREARYSAVLVPREMMAESPHELIECAQVAVILDGLHVTACMNEAEALADGFDGKVALTESAPWSCATWDRIRRASMASPIPIYFPTDVGAVETVHRLRDVLDGRVAVHAIAPEEWPAFWNSSNEVIAPGRGLVIAVAAEPLVDAWRRAVWESNRGLTTVPINSREIWPNARPTVAFLSLVFHSERCGAWLTNSAVYAFLDAIERQAEEIRRHSPRVLAAIAARLQLDVPTILRECARCDFTTRFAPSWVARLRDHSRGSVG